MVQEDSETQFAFEGPAGKRALVKKYSFEKNAIEVFTSVYLYLDKTD